MTTVGPKQDHLTRPDFPLKLTLQTYINVAGLTWLNSNLESHESLHLGYVFLFFMNGEVFIHFKVLLLIRRLGMKVNEITMNQLELIT